MNFANFDVDVSKDTDQDTVSVYSRVKIIDPVTDAVREEAINFTAISQLKPLPSMNLPPAGTSLLPESYTFFHFNYTQFRYVDVLGLAVYGVHDGHNVSFSATVPEPASLTLASLLGGSLALARRRRS